eukprot:UN06742
MNDDEWFWIDDNVKMLEVLSIPGFYELYRKPADNVKNFVYKMSETGLIFRRKASPKIVLSHDDPNDFNGYNGLMNFHGDLEKSELYQSYRLHDGRTVDVVHYNGLIISFYYNGQNYEFNSWDTIISSSVELVDDDRIEIKITSNFPDGDESLGEVEYFLLIKENSTLTEVNYSLKMFVDNAKNVRLTTVQKFPPEVCSNPANRVCYNEIVFFPALTEDEKVTFYRVESDVEGTETFVGQREWTSAVQQGVLGFSYGFHDFHDKERLQEVRYDIEEGIIRTKYTEYKFGKMKKDEAQFLQEEKLITAGGLYMTMEKYIEPFRHLRENVELVDYSISYDYGVEVHGMATHYFFANQGAYLYSMSLDEQDRLLHWCLEHIDSYITNFVDLGGGEEVFTRGEAFMLLAVTSLYMAHVNDNDAAVKDQLGIAFKKLYDVLLNQQMINEGNPKHGFFRCIAGGHNNGSQEVLYLDCHGGALFALARVAVLYKYLPIDINEVLERLRLGMAAFEAGAMPMGSDRPNNGNSELEWNYKSSLLLRAIHSIEIFMGENEITDYMDRDLSITMKEQMFKRKMASMKTMNLSKKIHK